MSVVKNKILLLLLTLSIEILILASNTNFSATQATITQCVTNANESDFIFVLPSNADLKDLSTVVGQCYVTNNRGDYLLILPNSLSNTAQSTLFTPLTTVDQYLTTFLGNNYPTSAWSYYKINNIPKPVVCKSVNQPISSAAAKSAFTKYLANVSNNGLNSLFSTLKPNEINKLILLVSSCPTTLSADQQSQNMKIFYNNFCDYGNISYQPNSSLGLDFLTLVSAGMINLPCGTAAALNQIRSTLLKGYLNKVKVLNANLSTQVDQIINYLTNINSTLQDANKSPYIALNLLQFAQQLVSQEPEVLAVTLDTVGTVAISDQANYYLAKAINELIYLAGFFAISNPLANSLVSPVTNQGALS